MQIGLDIAFLTNFGLLFHAYFIIFNASEKIYSDHGKAIKKKVVWVKEGDDRSMDWYFNNKYRVKRFGFDLKRKLYQGQLTFKC